MFIAFAFATAIVTAFIFGMVPAAVLWRVEPQDAVKEGTRTASATRGGLRGRDALVACELALAVVLLSGAGLMVKSFWRMHAHPPGFEPERILTLKVIFTPPRYLDPLQAALYVATFCVAYGPYRCRSSCDQCGRRGFSAGSCHTGRNISSYRGRSCHSDTSVCHRRWVHRAMGMRLVSGRWFSDDESSAAVSSRKASHTANLAMRMRSVAAFNCAQRRHPVHKRQHPFR